MGSLQVPDTAAPVSDHPCPQCGPDCRSPLNRRRKTLRVWNDGQGFISWRCARCDTTGWKKGTKNDYTAPSRQQPQQPPKPREELARLLWAKSLPLKGSPAEGYLRARQCFLDVACLRYLPPDQNHVQSMIGRFNSGAIHLTRLNADGTGKAPGNAKLMFGPVSGSPMVIRSSGSRLIICEGIEDGLSMAIAANKSHAIWVAGSASMMPKLVPAVNGYEAIMAFDLDKAGLNAYRKGLSYKPDLRSIRFPKQLDANTIIRQLDGVSRLRDIVLRRPTFHR